MQQEVGDRWFIRERDVVGAGVSTTHPGLGAFVALTLVSVLGPLPVLLGLTALTVPVESMGPVEVRLLGVATLVAVLASVALGWALAVTWLGVSEIRLGADDVEISTGVGRVRRRRHLQADGIDEVRTLKVGLWHGVEIRGRRWMVVPTGTPERARFLQRTLDRCLRRQRRKTGA